MVRIFLVSASLMACGLCQASPQQQPKQGDSLENGSVWEGTYNRVERLPNGKPDQLNTDGKLKITDRNGKDFKGELWLNNGEWGMELKGTVSDQGRVTIQFTKEIQGKWRKDWIGKARARGSVKGKKLVIDVMIPGQVFEAKLRVEKVEEK